ncbi:hypothetical protein Tco_0546712 [Tanacetum coccineum]
MDSGQISSGLDLTYAPSTITTQKPTEGELDLLFEAMYDGFLYGGSTSICSKTLVSGCSSTSSSQTPDCNLQLQLSQPRSTSRKLKGSSVISEEQLMWVSGIRWISILVLNLTGFSDADKQCGSKTPSEYFSVELNTEAKVVTGTSKKQYCTALLPRKQNMCPLSVCCDQVPLDV